MIRYILFAILLALLPAAIAAENLKEYWSSEYHYGIAYPSNWTPTTVGKSMEQDTFSIMNAANDANIYIMAKRFSPQNRGLYRSIKDIPNAKEELSEMLRNEYRVASIQFGETQLSNEPALWFSYSFAQRSLGQQVWFTAYQLSVLKNDIIFTITAKVSGTSQELAASKYKKYWPLIRRTIASVTFVN